MPGYGKKDLLFALGLATACFAGMGFTELLSRVPNGPISIWVATGFLAAAAIVSPVRRWPLLALAIVVAELTGNALWYGHEWGPALMFASANALAGLSGAFILRRIAGDGSLLCTVRRSAVSLAILIAAIPAISATIGAIALGWSYGQPPFAAWGRLYLGDATGAVIAAPLALLVLGAAAPRLAVRRRLPELALLMLTFSMLGFVALGGLVPFAFMMIVPLMWAALSFRVPGAILGNAGLLLLASLCTIYGVGPFAGNGVYAAFGNEGLQLFILAGGVSALLAGAIAEENRSAVRRLHEANHLLSERVEERTASLAASELKALESANLLKAIGDASPDLIFAKDRDGRLIYANRATLRATGLASVDDEHPVDGALFIQPVEHEHIRRNDQKVIESRETLVIDETYTDAAGEPRIFRSTKAPLYTVDGELMGLAGVSVDVTDAKHAEAREKMLVREIEHRSRNLLAVVQSIAGLTRAATVDEYRNTIVRRIHALARTNGTIVSGDWSSGLSAILEAELAPYDDGRVVISGEDVTLDRAAVQSLTLAIHELATNAAKYGALSAAAGRLAVGWRCEVDDRGERVLRIDWIESGGPPVVPPVHHGFGTTVVSAIASGRGEGKADFDWRAAGLQVRLTLPLLARPSPSATEKSGHNRETAALP